MGCQHLCHITLSLMSNIKHHKQQEVKSCCLLDGIIAVRIEIYPELVTQLGGTFDLLGHICIQIFNFGHVLQNREIIQIHQSQLEFSFIYISIMHRIGLFDCIFNFLSQLHVFVFQRFSAWFFLVARELSLEIVFLCALASRCALPF